MIAALSAFDVWMLEMLFAARDPDLVQLFILASQLGRSWIIYAIAIYVALILVLQRKYAYAMGLSISVASAGILILMLKGLVERVRPPSEFQANLEIWYSFPSAHAALSTTLYGFLAVLAWQMISRQGLRVSAVVMLVGLTIAISFSRMYLGVHYTTDVLAGIALGTVCVWIGWKYAKIARNGNP